MSLLYAWALTVGLTVAVPILLHLRRRQTNRRVSFPALRYLNRALDSRSRALVTSDLVLLVLRAGALVALAMAAAGLLLGRGDAADHRPTDLALVVDNSASTGRLAGENTLFGELMDRAREVLEFAHAEDRVWLFPSVGGEVARGFGAARALAELDRIALTDGTARLDEVVDRATAALPLTSDRAREVLLISDLQATGFGDTRASADRDPPLIVYNPEAELNTNGAIVDLELGGGFTTASAAGQAVFASTRRYGHPEQAVADATPEQTDTAEGTVDDETTVRLQLDGRLAGAVRVPWGQDGIFTLPQLSQGSHSGRFELDPDGLRTDDLRYFSIRVLPPPSVLHSGGSGSFVATGIDVLREAGRLGPNITGPVAMLEGASAAGQPPSDARTLIFVPPADPVDLPAFNQGLGLLGVPWRARADDAVGELDIQNPVAGSLLGEIRVRSRYRLEREGPPGESDSTLLSTVDGEPWVVRTNAGDRLAIVLASPFTAEASDLPGHAAMIPFLETLLVHWSHVGSWPVTDFEAGSTISLPPWVRQVIRPDGTSLQTDGGSPFVPLIAGVYTARGLDGDATSEERFAVNVPASEADLLALEPGQVAEHFPGRSVHVAGPGRDEWGSEVFRARRGREATFWLLLIAVGCLVAELVVATPGRAKRQSTGRPQSRSETKSAVTS